MPKEKKDNRYAMKIIDKTFEFESANAPSNALFLDIETTGLKAETSHLYLYGCIWQESPSHWRLRQWLAQTPFDERRILKEVNDHAAGFTRLVHFNGSRFDLPYLNAKAADFGLDGVFEKKESCDLYPLLKPLRAFLRLKNCRQKSFEGFLDTARKDLYNGGELISFYHRYVKTGDTSLEAPLLLHNEEDVLGTVKLLDLLPYLKLLNGEARLSGIELSLSDSEAVIVLSSEDRYPVCANALSDGIFIKAEKNKVSLKLPCAVQTLKYFFPNHRDYYYLISEDQAIHKSIAAFVNPANLLKASRENCYIKKTARFYPVFDLNNGQLFKESPAGRCYALWDDAPVSDPAYWSCYIGKVLKLLKPQ